MEVRHNWTHAEVRDLMEKPFMDLLFEAQLVHRQYQQTNHVQVSTLLSIKTGACPEDCKYCPQSARYTTDIEKERLMEVERVLELRKKPKMLVLLVSVWALHGKTLKSVTCRI